MLRPPWWKAIGHRTLTCVLFLLPVSSLRAQAATSPEMKQDRARQDRAIHWPKEFDPAVAPVFSHNDLLIHARCSRTFGQLANATDWPNWVGFLKDVSFETAAPMQDGSLLKLTIFGSTIQSRVTEFVPAQRISWIPYGSDETETRHGHYHTWHFVPESADTCRVITEEQASGLEI